mgnify:CR=1 FL=1
MWWKCDDIMINLSKCTVLKRMYCETSKFYFINAKIDNYSYTIYKSISKNEIDSAFERFFNLLNLK